MFGRTRLCQVLACLWTLLVDGVNASNISESCEEDSMSCLQGNIGTRVVQQSLLRTENIDCDCIYTKKGDYCWKLCDIFGDAIEDIVLLKNGKQCQDEPEIYPGDKMCVLHPTKNFDQCENPSPPSPPSPGLCQRPDGFQVELYWMPYVKTDPIPSSEILKRVSKVIMAFVGTYHYTAESHWTHYTCEEQCTFPDVWPITEMGNNWAQQMKAVNPELEVTVSFGGWNQGPGDDDKNCYLDSGCYANVCLLADELEKIAKQEYIDGIDLDYEMSKDLEICSASADDTSVGVRFLGELRDLLQQKGVAVSHGPQPPYFGAEGPGSGSFNRLLEKYPKTKDDHMAIQFYNNDGFQIGVDDQAISALYWNAVHLTGGDASKLLLGLCFVDCNPGYSAFDPADAAASSTLAPNLLQTTMAGGEGFGGIMIWANPKSTHSGGHCDDGCFSMMPHWLDTVCHSVGGLVPPTGSG